MSSEIIEDIKRATETARARGYLEGLRDMTDELESYMIPAVRKNIMGALWSRYEAAHPELKDATHG